MTDVTTPQTDATTMPDGVDKVLSDWKQGDFIRVTPNLIASCGGDLVVAILMARLLYRTFDGTRWWPTTAGQMAEDTGLSILQVRRGLKVLRGKGWILSRRVDQWNPTLEYKVATGDDSKDAPRDTPQDASHVPPQDASHVPPQDASLPYKKEEKQEEHQEQHQGAAAAAGVMDPHQASRLRGTDLAPSSQPAVLELDLDPAGEILPFVLKQAESPEFQRFWELYPQKKAKGAARRSWDKAVSKAEPAVILAALAEQVPELLSAHKRGLSSRERRSQCPHPSTWLNAERWEDELDCRDTPVSDSPFIDTTMRAIAILNAKGLA